MSRGTRNARKPSKAKATKTSKGREAKTANDEESTGRTVDAGGESPEGQTQPVVRDDKGRFPAGVSGNPNGRPKGRKNVITALKQDLEIALREGLTVDDVQAVVKSMLAEALNGNVGAGKLILDKVMSNAKEGEEEKETGGGLKIIIENATLEALHEPSNIIDVTPTEVNPNE